jgi:hypothetical protein
MPGGAILDCTVSVCGMASTMSWPAAPCAPVQDWAKWPSLVNESDVGITKRSFGCFFCWEVHARVLLGCDFSTVQEGGKQEN